MEVTIVTNGSIKNMDFLQGVIKGSDYVICADGGAKYLMDLKIYPDLLVGDLDSIDKKTLNWAKEGNIKVERFPPKKDMTDTELAVDFALKENPSKINIVGATGSRLDHSLANVMLLYKIHKVGIRSALIDEINYMTITDSVLKLRCKVGQTISIVPIGGDVKGVTLKGFEYPLINHNIEMGSSLGVSNKSISDEVVISVNKGILLVVKVFSEE